MDTGCKSWGRMWRQNGSGRCNRCGLSVRLEWQTAWRPAERAPIPCDSRLLLRRWRSGMVDAAGWEGARMPPFHNVWAMIANPPLVEVRRIDTGQCRLFLKLENQNPAGSIKDRIALSMIEAAEADGRLKAGGTIIEATAGNTGLGLALVAALKGY